MINAEHYLEFCQEKRKNHFNYKDLSGSFYKSMWNGEINSVGKYGRANGVLLLEITMAHYNI